MSFVIAVPELMSNAATNLADIGSTISSASAAAAAPTTAVVAAGAVVTKDVPAHALMMGVPARVAGWACGCGATLKFEHERATCADCHREYQRQDQAVSLVAGPALP